MIDISLMPEPTLRLASARLALHLWGWPGFRVDESLLSGWDHDAPGFIRSFLERAHGVFFVLIEERAENKWTFFSDLYTCKKVFYLLKEGRLFLADFLCKLKPWIAGMNDLDRAALGLYLLFGYLPGNGTLYRPVKSLKPFTYYEFTAGRLAERQYYKVDFSSPEDIDFNEATTEVFSRFEAAFLEHTRSFERFLVPLSGGRDSRFLLALALKHFDKKQVTTFTFGQPGSLDYEIGRGLAKKYGLHALLLPFNPKTYLAEHILPATPFKNGLINHVQESPARFYRQVLGDDDDRLILSGYIGDAVLAFNHQRRMIKGEMGDPLPAASHFSYEAVLDGPFADCRGDILDRVKVLAGLMVEDDGRPEAERWLYYVHAPCFTNPCLFAEEKSYPFALPFVDRGFFDFIARIPAHYKQRPDFYCQVLRCDPFVFNFFHYPLKNLRGAGYENNVLVNGLYRARLYGRALWKGARPKKNYIDFDRIFSDRFLDKEIAALRHWPRLAPLLAGNDLTSKKKRLLYSLRLNLETFFG